jgi:hypothetical protein
MMAINMEWEDPIIEDLEDITQLCCVIGGCSAGYSSF